MSRNEPGYDVVVVGARVGGRRHRLPARPARPACPAGRPQPVRHRHPVDTRPHARRPSCSSPGGVCSTRSSPRALRAVRRTTFRYADDLVPITLKESYGVRRPVRAAAHRP